MRGLQGQVTVPPVARWRRLAGAVRTRGATEDNLVSDDEAKRIMMMQNQAWHCEVDLTRLATSSVDVM